MLKACAEKGLHRTVDTSGFADTQTLLEVAKHTDLFLYDLKFMDTEKHKKWTGVDNQLILKNLKTLAENGANINIRIPLVKNVNADENELTNMAKFISELSGKKSLVNILPYHNIAVHKYNKLGEEYQAFEMAEPTEKEQNQAIEIFQGFDLVAEIGG
jgi:pyruvate formate lyase activating enzyme